MRTEEVSFLQAEFEMERLRDGQMTLGPESGPRVGPSPCYLSAPGSALSAPISGSSPLLCVGDFSFSFIFFPFFWQIDLPFTAPLSPLHSLLASPTPPFVDTRLGGAELTQRVLSLTSLTPCILFLPPQAVTAFATQSYSGSKILCGLYQATDMCHQHSLQDLELSNAYSVLLLLCFCSLCFCSCTGE